MIDQHVRDVSSIEDVVSSLSQHLRDIQHSRDTHLIYILRNTVNSKEYSA